MRILKSMLIIIVVASLLLPKVRAAESALSLSPAIFESVIDRGGYLKTEIFLTNLTNFPLPIKGWATAFLPSEQVPASAEGNYDASSWFKLEPEDFILQPNERKKIILTITAPRNAEPGGHYATVFWQPLIPEGVLTQPAMLARVGLLSLLVIPGNLLEQINSQPISHPQWLTFGPLNLQLKFANSGNVHTTVSGNITITNLFKRQVGTLSLDSTTILPGTEKSLSLLWDQRLGFGPYFLEPNFTYGAANTQLSVPITVIWYIPWPLLLSGILLLTFFYKFFILNIDRVKLAWRALRGNLQEKESSHDQDKIKQKVTQKNPRGRHFHHLTHRTD